MLPALEAAVAALDSLNKADIIELKVCVWWWWVQTLCLETDGA